MHSLLADSLKVVLPELGPQLISPSGEAELQGLASHLAPIVCGGFECRLEANAPQVDFQQCIGRDADEIAALQEHLAAILIKEDAINQPEWRRLQTFLKAWQSYLEPILELWLEFDLPCPSTELPFPALFIGLSQDVAPATKTYAAAVQALNLLLEPSGWQTWQGNLERCFRACPTDVFISHIGVMASRGAAALRVNVKRLQPDMLRPYLQQVGWSGDVDGVDAMMQQLFGLVDRITICLDVGSQVYPQIGFECIFLKQPEQDQRWGLFFDYLVRQGLCTDAKRESLLSWPGFSNPTNTIVPWPEQLVIASLLQSQHSFTSFERRLSHIKVGMRPGCPAMAKAYLWFKHQWLPGGSK